jgi:hypothetical protein
MSLLNQANKLPAYLRLCRIPFHVWVRETPRLNHFNNFWVGNVHIHTYERRLGEVARFCVILSVNTSYAHMQKLAHWNLKAYFAKGVEGDLTEEDLLGEFVFPGHLCLDNDIKRTCARALGGGLVPKIALLCGEPKAQPFANYLLQW